MIAIRHCWQWRLSIVHYWSRNSTIQALLIRRQTLVQLIPARHLPSRSRRHLVPEPAQYFATFPKTKGAEEIQIIKWRSIPGEPQQKYSKHGDPATVLDYLSLQNFSKRQHGRGYPLSILKRQTNFMEHLESVKGMP
ncbi:hypothetical protein JMJ77_0002517 [Colletotrichum scovillei]|uniref:Uncharacterized protein n=1 Tax=Colletotrichum scovillei TaxID=1209932 RepID=A0A9P7UDE2_9PEZI|nr:hypothetical protein JMJ77_0002517 [Colletotrichum scovillei]KAG7070938.1 hypothetical protein JMJ76_0002180 [Colletotrichum scovillei]KAG7079222.1 hypothetical protein JMJ78_0002878 [Colletotrichum scovillei]